MTALRWCLSALLPAAFLESPLHAQVVINEIHYHPVEESIFDGTTGRTFDTAGNPIFSDTLAPADYSEDIHEFLEIYNAGPTAVDIGGWHFTSGVLYTFPASTTLAAGAYKVVARNPARLQSVYKITGVLGPYTGKLSNDGDTITLLNSTNALVDSVTYSAHFPWAQSADALAVNKDWLGFDPVLYQYKGRSLQRVSVSAPSSSPANWVASPLSPGPTPGSANALASNIPKPVVTAFGVAQTTDGAPIIRAAKTVTLSATFSSTQSLSGVQVEYFLDDINSYTEARQVLAMTEAPVGSGQYSVVLPSQVDRSVVRFRIKANRGTGSEVVSPRADDPQVVPVSATVHEAWHAYFVSPARAATRPVYDCFVSAASLSILDSNINQGPSRRITAQGNPREMPYVLPTEPQWNGVQPAIFIDNGVVHDIQIRYHGSRYRRSVARQSYKCQFPGNNLLRGTIQEVFETDKARDTGNHPNTEWAHAIYRAAGVPTAYTQHVDLYLNGNGALEQLEQSVCDDRLMTRYYDDLAKLDRSQPKLTPGDVYKCKSTDEGSNGPYVTYTGQQITANRTSGTGNLWTPLHQYRWNLTMQNNEWKGWKPLKDMVDAMTSARATGNTTTIRNWLAANWDVDRTLTEIAIRNWSCCWDDSFHNYFLYKQADAKWTMLPWDFDYEFADKSSASDIYTTTGNSFKDIFLTYYRTEYKQKLWLLNNTLLSPARLVAMGIDFGSWTTDRQNYVNSTLALGTFFQPAKPVTLSPGASSGVISPASFTGSTYSHSSGTLTGTSAHTRSKWEVRESTGTYTDPIYVLSSSTSLTSLPIPFSALTLGKTYAWRVTYYDALDHPSTTSDEASFVYGAGPVTNDLILMDAATAWRYNITIQPAVLTWTATGYNDSAWPTAPAPLGHSTATLPVPIRTDLGASTRTTFYFRKSFEFNGNVGPSTTLRLRQYIDDGVIFYLNGVELQRTRLVAAASDQYAQAATTAVVNATQEPSASTWYTVPATALQSGTNVLSASVHQFSGDTTDFIFGAELQVTYTATGGSVAINEICADNRSIISNGGAYPDYIELYNRGSSDVDLSGFGLTDDPLVPAKYSVPPGTLIAAGAYLVVWCNSDTAAPGLHTGFRLDAGGQSVALFTPGANPILVDYVTFGLQPADLAIGRVTDGSGSFTLITPSPGAPNVARAVGAVTSLRMNEWMANPASGQDWFELYNADANPVALSGLYLSDDSALPTLTQIPALSYIAPKGWQKFLADSSTAGANHCNFKLASGGDSLVLTNTNGISQLNAVTFGAQAQGVSEGRLPDGAPSVSGFAQSSSPGASNWLPAPVVINEALTHSTPPLEDAIELANPTAASINIGGWWLSDDASALQKYQIPAGTTLVAGAFKVFYEFQFNPTPGVGNSFSLSSLGDEIYLSAVDANGALTGYRAQVRFGAAADGVSFGRVAIGGGGQAEFWPLRSRSFGADNPTDVAQFRTGQGAANSAPRTGPMIFNEVMYHPPDIAGTVPLDNPLEEYIELHNITTQPTDLSGWKLRGDSDFVFATGTIVRPGDYIVLLTFDPVTNPTQLQAFRSRYFTPVDARFYGPYSPKLSNQGQNLELAYPGPVVGTATPYILVDKLQYLDSLPWPAAYADGGGYSLQRLSREGIGNDPLNFLTTLPTPGYVNSGGQQAIVDSDGDAIPDTFELANGLDKFNAADALLDFDGDGQTNRAEYLAGTDPRNGASVLKTALSPVSGGFQIQFTAVANRGYSLLQADSPNGPWLKLQDFPAQPVQTPQSLTDLTTAPQRFYKLVTPAQ